MSPGRSFFVTSSLSGRSGLFDPKSTITGNVGDRAGFDRALDRRPLGPAEVRGLDADDEPGDAQRHLGGRLRLHVGQVLLVLPAAHAVADDVEEGEDAGLRAVDDALLEVLEVAPARAAGVRHRRHADAEGEAVRVDAVVARIRAALAGAGVDVARGCR